MKEMQVPVVLIVFNRPGSTRLVFERIAATRPSHLFLVADGPRTNRDGEAEACAQVRKIVTAVNWPCKVETNFADHNMGCRHRMISGLNWVFSQVEEAIILEDDCLPDLSFFSYCNELLERYRAHEHIGAITGYQALKRKAPHEYSYLFSRQLHVWGWATWRRAWKQYDEHLTDWPEVKRSGLLRQLFRSKRLTAYWSDVFDRIYSGIGPDTWDYQWVYTGMVRGWLNIAPGINLVQNIGFGEGATHTTNRDPDLMAPSETLTFPLRHPPAIIADWSFDLAEQRHFLAPGLFQRVRRKWNTMIRPRFQLPI